jgi:hypothetical protein
VLQPAAFLFELFSFGDQDACVVVDGAVSYGLLDTFSRIRVVIDQRRETHCL